MAELSLDKVVLQDVLAKKSLAEIIANARSSVARVWIVEMPVNPRHLHNFYALDAWLRYRAHLQRMAEQQGAEYVVASDWIGNPEHFQDHLHLAPPGGSRIQSAAGRLSKFAACDPTAR